MLQSLNLHRASQQADWEKIPKGKRNQWQRLAAKTHGLLTPANVISLLGAFITVVGLVRIIDDLNLFNISLIVIGRLADIADGYIAHQTRTKSPLGEVIDAGIDKILAFIAVVALALGGLAPPLVIILVLIYSIFNSAVSASAKLQKKPIHPTREGKLAGAACWGVIGLFPLYHLVIDDYEQLSLIILVIAMLISVAFIWYGIRSMGQYYQLWRK